MANNSTMSNNSSLSTNSSCPATVRDMPDITFFACASGYSPNQTAGMEACCNNAPIARYGTNGCWQYCNVSSQAAEKRWFDCWTDQHVKVANGIAVCFNYASLGAPSFRPPVSKAGLAVFSLLLAGMVSGLLV